MLLSQKTVEEQLEKYGSDWIIAFHIVHPEHNNICVVLGSNYREQGFFKAIFNLFDGTYSRVSYEVGALKFAKIELYRLCEKCYPSDADFEYIPVENQLYSFVEDV
jgi:hypothetical protein